MYTLIAPAIPERYQSTMALIYIGIGSNLDDPLSHVREAISELRQLKDCRFQTVSGLYKSRPLPIPQPDQQKAVAPSREHTPEESQAQPDYINAVAAIETDRNALSLLDDLQAIENQHGRVRSAERWGPRTLDLDVLLIDDKIINHARLIIPHPGLHERSFVLYPLQEIAPDLSIPDHNSKKSSSLKELVARCDDEGLERLYDA